MHAKSYINQILKIDLNLKLESHAKSDADCLLDFSDDFYTKSYTKPYPIWFINVYYINFSEYLSDTKSGMRSLLDSWTIYHLEIYSIRYDWMHD